MSTAALAECLDGAWTVTCAGGPLADLIGGWPTRVLSALSQWVAAETSSYFPPGEQVPADCEFLTEPLAALSVHPVVVAGHVGGLLITADEQPAYQDPSRTVAMELLATQTAGLLATARAMAELSRLALQDPLTGLQNRRGLTDELHAAARRGTKH